jgi:hypothetical protein
MARTQTGHIGDADSPDQPLPPPRPTSHIDQHLHNEPGLPYHYPRLPTLMLYKIEKRLFCDWNRPRSRVELRGFGPLATPRCQLLAEWLCEVWHEVRRCY